jgi:hypothetical protein
MFFATLAGAFVGTAVADAFFTGDQGASDAGSVADAGDAGDFADVGGGDLGGTDFGGGDFGGF